MTNKLKVLIGVNIILVSAIVFSVFSVFPLQSNDVKGKPFFNLADLSQVNQFDINGQSIVRLEDGRWVMNGKVDVSPIFVGRVFQAMQQTQIIENKKSMPTDGKDITVYVASTPVFTGSIASEGDVMAYGNRNGEIFSIEMPGQFLNLEELFDANEKDWRDKTVFRTSWRTLKNFELTYNRNPENDVNITFKDPFYSVQNVKALDSAAVYQFVTSLPRVQVDQYEVRNSFIEDTVKKYRPFCEIIMEDLVADYNAEVFIYPFDNKVFAYFPNSNEVGTLNTKVVQDLLVSWHFFDANDPRKKNR
ncbi:hypothetical protein [Flammeovirga sp. SubArs3]|uniref:hypothetical protein n=1 Tax=Flammeovirga sp. SubArs3 TaxID=2995316 RepID=UPI00248C0EF2|nr:hypothetical protein [Flammeovirga sp. SubArs3]